MSSRNLAVLLALSAGLLFAWAWLAPRPLPEGRLARARLFHQAGRTEEAHELAMLELQTRPSMPVARLVSDIALELPFFLLPEIQTRLAEGARGPARDASLYSLALIAAKMGDLQGSLRWFGQIERPRQAFVAHSYALVLSRLGERELAEELWRTEVALEGGFLESAVPSLGDLLREKGDLAGLERLARDPLSGVWLRADQHLWLALQGRPALANLAKALARRWLQHSLISWVGALCIAGLWIYLLWRLDAFETEPVWALATVFLGGCLATLLVNDVLYGLLDLLHPDPPATHDLSRYILHTGVAEELTKLIPVALFCRYSRQVNEPFDYLVYGSLAALGFATMENAFYFDVWAGQDTMLARFITCVVLHVFGTTAVCYVWAWCRHRGRSPWLWGLVACVGACVAHGLYDAADLPLKQVQVMLEALALSQMYARALGWSPFLRPEKELAKRWVNSSAIEAGALLMVLLPFLDRHLHTATELAWYGLSTTATPGNLALLAAVFVPLEVIGLRSHGLFPQIGLEGSVLRNLLWLWGCLSICSQALSFDLTPGAWVVGAGMVLLAMRLRRPGPLVLKAPVVGEISRPRRLWTPLQNGRELFTGTTPWLEAPGHLVQVLPGASPAELLAAHEQALASLTPTPPEDLEARYQESQQRTRDSFAVAPVLRTLQLAGRLLRARLRPVPSRIRVSQDL